MNRPALAMTTDMGANYMIHGHASIREWDEDGNLTAGQEPSRWWLDLERIAA